MNLLIRMPNWLGDFVMAQALIREVKKSTDYKIFVCGKEPLLTLLKNDPNIESSFSLSERPNIEFDIGLLLTNSFSSALHFSKLRVKRKIGYRSFLRWFLLDDQIKKEFEHEVEVYKRLLTPLGIKSSSLEPQIFVTSEEKREAKKILLKEGWREKPLIFLAVEAAYGNAKCWPLERYRELAKKLIKADREVAFIGSQPNEEIFGINLLGKTSLKQLSSLLSFGSFFVGNDSGPAHLAAALSIPTLVLFGSTAPLRTAPYSKMSKVIYKESHCSPCFKRECPFQLECMKEITVEEVFEICLRIG